jgi:hypothetical protein
VRISPSEIEAVINSSGEKISRRQHDPSEEMLIVFQAEQEKIHKKLPWLYFD